MKDEINKILDGLEKISTPTGISYSGDVTINNADVKILKDYITNLQEENQKLKEHWVNLVGENLLMNEMQKLEEKIDKANEYIKENTRWFDSEYAKVYGELCDCEGANSNRLEVLVNPSNLSKILGGEDNE